MEFNLQYQPFHSKDPIPKRPNSPIASTNLDSQKQILNNYSFGSLNEFLTTQCIINLPISNPENIPNVATKPTNYQSPSTTQNSRFTL